MTQATATEPLADVQEGDWIIRESPHQRATETDTMLTLHRVNRRTKARIWIGCSQYRLSGSPIGEWARDRMRLPKSDDEVLGLLDAERHKAQQRNESGKEYSRKRERYIALIYATARASDHSGFIYMLGHWESGTWDDDLVRIDAANQPKGTD